MIFGFNTDVKVGDAVYHVQSEARRKELLLQTQVFVRGRCIAKCATPFPEPDALPELFDDELQELLKAQHRRVIDSVRKGLLEEDMAIPPIAAKGASALEDPAAADPPISGLLELLEDSESPAAHAGASSGVPEVLTTPDGPLPVTQAEPLSSESAWPQQDVAKASAEAGAESAPAATLGLDVITEEMCDSPTLLLAATPEGLSTGSLVIECLNADSVLSTGNLVLLLQVTRNNEPVQDAELTLRLVWGQDPAQYAYAATDGRGIAEVAMAVDTLASRNGRVLVQAAIPGTSATRRFGLHPPG